MIDYRLILLSMIMIDTKYKMPKHKNTFIQVEQFDGSNSKYFSYNFLHLSYSCSCLNIKGNANKNLEDLMDLFVNE